MESGTVDLQSELAEFWCRGATYDYPYYLVDEIYASFFFFTLVAWYSSSISHVALETFRFEPVK